jgi:outer membrane receptor for Fe3+-dicitrate
MENLKLPVPPRKEKYESKKETWNITPIDYSGSLADYLNEHAFGTPLENIQIEALRDDYVGRVSIYIVKQLPGNEAGYQQALAKYEEELKEFCTCTLQALSKK